jgi:hypothetical protein
MTAEHLQLEERMAAFARTFPSMTKASGVKLWEANTLDRWAAATPISPGELVTARFLLAVWDPEQPWQCGRFDLMEALQVWDEKHRAAFVAWAEDPWWP